jgi:hypothetical protein
MRTDEGHGPVFFSEQSRFVVSKGSHNHQTLAIANYIQKTMCETDMIALAQFQPAA